MYGLNVNFKTIFFRQDAKNSVREKSGGGQMPVCTPPVYAPDYKTIIQLCLR